MRWYTVGELHWESITVHRRTFLQTSFAAVLAAPLTRLAIADDPSVRQYRDTIGLQLYTLRGPMAEDMPGTLKAVADAGYKQVELMDAVTGGDIARTARDLGMDVTSAFLNWKTIVRPDDADAPSEEETLDAATAMGLKHLVFGYVDHDSRKTADQYRTWAERANRFGEMCREADVRLCYHNHSFEFEPLPVGSVSPADAKTGPESGCGFEILFEEFDADLVPFELDVFWAAIGGYDPVETLARLTGRLTQVHLKDLQKGTPTIYDNSAVPHEAFQELGDGTVDIAACMAAAAKAGAVQCHVEQDQSPDPVMSITQSMRWLKGQPAG